MTTTEEVADALQSLVINDLKRIYAEHDNPTTRQFLTDDGLKQTLELVCDSLPEQLREQIREILALHTLLGRISIDRYYVQCLSTDHFVVRERQADQLQPGPSDLIVCDEFSTWPDAACYAKSMNRIQRKLDLIYGRWTKHGGGSTQTEETEG
jgi:hypothetical protein